MMRVLRVVPILLFGLLFAGGGLFFFATTALPTWLDWRAMQAWQPVTAELESVGGADNETRARYRYAFNGIDHVGERVYVATFKDNIGPYHGELRAELRRLQRSGAPLTVWVNPLNPTEAVIDREMRWGLFAFMSAFCGVFVLIGLFVAYAGLRWTGKHRQASGPSLRELRREWTQRQAEPGFDLGFIEYARQRAAEAQAAEQDDALPADWQLRKGWESATLRSEAKRKLMVIWGFAVVWNAASWPMLLVLPEELAEGNQAALLVLLFPLVGLVLLFQALRRTQEYRRFGIVSLAMDPYPGAIGGHVGGWIEVARLGHGVATAPDATLRVRLECVYSYMSGSGKNRSRRERIQWAEEGVPRAESAGRGVRLAFRFDVPDELPQAAVEQRGNYYFWRLGVKGDIPGIDLDRQFNIPVFKTGETSSGIRHDISAQVAEREAEASEAARQSIERGDFDLPGLSRAMRYSEFGGEINMAFPMFRNKLLTGFSTVFAVGFSFASYHMIGMSLEGDAFGVVIGLFSLPFIVVAVLTSLASVYLLFNNLRVRIARSEITVLRRLLFVPVFFRRLRVNEISHLSIKRSGSTGEGVKRITHFKVLAHDRQGRKLTLAEDIDGEDVAGHFRDYLARRLNVEVRG